MTSGCCGAPKRIWRVKQRTARNPQKPRLGMLLTLPSLTIQRSGDATLCTLSLLVVQVQEQVQGAGGDFLVPAARILRPSWYFAGAASCYELSAHRPMTPSTLIKHSGTFSWSIASREHLSLGNSPGTHIGRLPLPPQNSPFSPETTH